jgi:hypothetical protein
LRVDIQESVAIDLVIRDDLIIEDQTRITTILFRQAGCQRIGFLGFFGGNAGAKGEPAGGCAGVCATAGMDGNERISFVIK